MKLQKDYLKKKRIWCNGCGLFLVEKIIAEEMERVGWNRKNTVLVSGIGCSARISEYFNLDTLHVTHGRTIPVAEGIKLANPKINVAIISGDGDLLSIGGNHLLHGARRNLNLKIFCNNNSLYAMTGGQTAASTPRGMETKTDPDGSKIEPINVKQLLTSNINYFFAKTTTLNLDHFQEAVAQSLKWKGFSFVDITSPCVSDIERKIKTDNMGDILKHFELKNKENKFAILKS